MFSRSTFLRKLFQIFYLFKLYFRYIFVTSFKKIEKQYLISCIPKIFLTSVLFLDENTRMFRGEGDGGMKRVECNLVNNIHLGLDKLALY